MGVFVDLKEDSLIRRVSLHDCGLFLTEKDNPVTASSTGVSAGHFFRLRVICVMEVRSNEKHNACDR